jgi:hypothetical protein
MAAQPADPHGRSESVADEVREGSVVAKYVENHRLLTRNMILHGKKSTAVAAATQSRFRQR